MATVLEATPDASASDTALSTATEAPGPVGIGLERLYRLSVAQYDAMVEAGILGEDVHLELIDGLLIAKMTTNPPHILLTALVREWFQSHLPSGWHIREEKPIETDRGRPEPDLAIVAGGVRDYAARQPTAAETALVVEVAHSSIKTDLAKASIYAAAGIALYIIVDVEAKRLLVHRDPGETGYASVETAAEVPISLGDTAIGTLRHDDVFEPAN